MRSYTLGLITLMLVFSIACQTNKAGEKKKNPWLSLWLPFSSERVRQVYRHSLIESPRYNSDCGYYCPDVDIWQYQYKDKETGEILTSDMPISIQKRFWKSPDEARIIAISLFGGKDFYYKALLQYIESFKSIKELNNITDPIWGYETFTVRVYVPKRNPKDLERLGEIKNREPAYMIDNLLELGCEIAYVDNKLPEAKKDGTFWRFASISDQMPKGEKVRYLMRDADNILTAAEMYAVADWIKSGLRYHRMHFMPICIGPLTAMLWGGYHAGGGDFHDFHELVRNYPYRFQYGDDELFSRDLLWQRIKAIGSVLTHRFPRSRFISTLASPYSNSCEEPTQEFCLKLNPHSDCRDVEMPNSKEFGGVIEALALRASLDDLVRKQPDIFNLQLDRRDRQFIYYAFKSK